MAPHIHLCPRNCAHHKAELLKKKKLIFLKRKPDHSPSWPSQWLSTAIKMKCSLLSSECFINWCNLPFFPGAAKHTGLLSRPQVFVTSSARNHLSQFPMVISFTSPQSQLLFLPQKGLPWPPWLKQLHTHCSISHSPVPLFHGPSCHLQFLFSLTSVALDLSKTKISRRGIFVLSC